MSENSMTVTSEPRALGGRRHAPDGLSAEEERRLVGLLRAGLRHGPDKAPEGLLAREAEIILVAEHFDLVRSLGTRMGRRPGTDVGALEGAGFEALVRAVRTFDPTRGPRLACYAAICVARAMGVARESLGRGREVTCAGFGRACDEITTGSTVEREREMVVLVSLDDVPEIAAPAADVEDEAFALLEAATFHEALSTLPADDRRLLTRRHGLDGDDPVSQLALAEELGMTRKALRCREDAVAKRLRGAYLRLGGAIP